MSLEFNKKTGEFEDSKKSFMVCAGVEMVGSKAFVESQFLKRGYVKKNTGDLIGTFAGIPNARISLEERDGDVRRIRINIKPANTELFEDLYSALCKKYCKTPEIREDKTSSHASFFLSNGSIFIYYYESDIRLIYEGTSDLYRNKRINNMMGDI
ncbi:MAG: hypothetical protein KBT32_05110 [Bacteroidales bacterium]|nr:hypothetical protein [Candidatus Physcocola equi]